MVSILILTRNEEQDLPGCLRSVDWSDDVHVLDSFSTDRTAEIARQFGARVLQRPFDNWAAHQNWALKNVPFKYPWVFYLDADERITEALHDSIIARVGHKQAEVAFRIRRRDFFADGTWLKHAQLTQFYIRLFCPEQVHYERLVNPVTLVAGAVGELDGYLDHYPFSKGIGFWFQRHISYADFEARMILEAEAGSGSVVRALFCRTFEERRRQQKRVFYSLPFRPLLKFCYMMLVRGAFLDGRAGMTYAVLQSIYEYLIVLKTRELGHRKIKAPGELNPAGAVADAPARPRDSVGAPKAVLP
jgi:glycosyltransferase involved in cell wall biosynthesis